MSSKILVSEETLLEWYFSPSIAQPTSRPKPKQLKAIERQIACLQASDDPAERSAAVRLSITLTMQFVTAEQPPLRHGYKHRPLATVERPDDKALTLFWSIYETRVDPQQTTPEGGVRTETHIRYYGFDAGGRLMLAHTSKTSREARYRNTYYWLEPGDLTYDAQDELLRSLGKYRRELMP